MVEKIEAENPVCNKIIQYFEDTYNNLKFKLSKLNTFFNSLSNVCVKQYYKKQFEMKALLWACEEYIQGPS